MPKSVYLYYFSLYFFYIFQHQFLKNKFRKYGIIVNEYEEKLIKVYLDTLGSIKDILLQKKQDYFLNQFSKNISKQAYTNVKNSFLLEMPRLFIEIFIVVTISLLVYFLISKTWIQKVF